MNYSILHSAQQRPNNALSLNIYDNPKKKKKKTIQSEPEIYSYGRRFMLPFLLKF